MKEKKEILFLILLVINLISASKSAKQHGSKIVKRSKPITKPGKSDSVAGYLVRTNKGKIYLAKGKKRTETETDLGGLDQGKKSKKTETDIEGLVINSKLILRENIANSVTCHEVTIWLLLIECLRNKDKNPQKRILQAP